MRVDNTWTDLDLVFATAAGGPLDPANVHRQHETICYLAEVRYIRFHDLRHTCATLLLEQGVELITFKNSSATPGCTSPSTSTPTSDPACTATLSKP